MDKPGLSEISGNVDSLSMVRLERLAKTLELSEGTRLNLRTALLDGIDVLFSEVRQRGTLQRPPIENRKQDPHSSWSVDKLEYQIRRAVDADVKWEKIAPFAWKMFEIDSSAPMAGRLVELSFLQGGLKSAIEVMESLAVRKINYFSSIHPKLKEPLIISLWCRSEVTLLEDLIPTAATAPTLLPIERYFAFWYSLHGNDHGRPVMYYQKHKMALLHAAEEFGDRVGFTKDKFLLVLGRLHLEIGMEQNARILLESINSNSKEYADALDTLLKLKITKNASGHSIYAAKLNAEPEWQKRIFLLRTFFANCRRKGSFRDANRPALNEILSNPLKWFPKTVDAWSSLSELIAENLDLQTMLPELTRVFRENALYMHSASLDQALWSGVLLHVAGNDGVSKYFRGVGKLHYYLASGSPKTEASLWKARDLIDQANATGNNPYFKEWQDFHRFAFQFVSKSLNHSEANREQVIRQIKVATDPRLLAVSDITRYLEDCTNPSLDVLVALQYQARSRHLHDVEAAIILKRASLSHLTNRDLENLWKLSISQNNWDQAWRTISVLSHRKKVKVSIQQAWQISGEKRSFAPLIQVGQKHCMSFFSDFSDDEKKLIYSCSEVGRFIPELLYYLDSNAKYSKPRSYRSDSIEFKVVQFLNEIKWLPQQKKEYQYTLDGVADSASNLPFFVNSIPNNQWSFTFQELANRLGVSSWNWRLSRLHDQIEDLIPRLVNRKELHKNSTRISRWMKGLNAEQKGAWNDFSRISSRMNDEEASFALCRFLIRLTTLTCVNHLEALKSLYAMKVPAFIIWDFENWILGPSYSQYRASLGLESKVSVPRSLRNLDIL